jgi:seryl-tRNA synthetase
MRFSGSRHYRVGGHEMARMVLFGSCTAITVRMLIAILENSQEEDGSIAVPSVPWEFGAPRKMGSEQAGV